MDNSNSKNDISIQTTAIREIHIYIYIYIYIYITNKGINIKGINNQLQTR